MNRPELSPEVIEHFRRERLLDALAEVVLDCGYRNLTVDHIVTTARASRKTFYDLFPNKKVAFEAALAGSFADLEQAVDAARASASAEDCWSRVGTALAAGLAWIEANPARASLCLVEAPVAGLLALKAQMSFCDGLVDRLDAAVPADKDTPRLRWELIVAGVLALVSQQIAAGRADRVSDLAPDLLQFARLCLWSRPLPSPPAGRR